MKENGKKCNYLFKDAMYLDITGQLVSSERTFYVWCDESMGEIIEKVEGVTGVYNPGAKTEFVVYIDARYDKKTIQEEIVAAFKNAGQ